jgi:crossover junction endodeoxyribonuclease RusA
VTEHIELTLPFPPSVNTYWRRHGHTVFIAKAGQMFRTNVLAAVWQQIGRPKPLKGRLSVALTLRRKDKRLFDVDNFAKAALDALAHAGVYENDSQIDRLTIERGELDRPNGSMRVVISQEQES